MNWLRDLWRRLFGTSTLEPPPSSPAPPPVPSDAKTPTVPPPVPIQAVDPPIEPAWLAVARGEIGVKESATGTPSTPRILEYDAATALKATTDHIPWCASFASWCLERAGVRSTRSAAAASYITWGQPTPPRPGAITVIYSAKIASSRNSNGDTHSGNHVGFLLSVDDTGWTLLGGNESKAVRVKFYARVTGWTLRAMRWPV